MKNIKYLITVFSIFILASCGQINDGIEGVWVRKTPNKMNDSIFIKKNKDNLYTVEFHATMHGKPVNSKKVTARFENDVVYLENDKFFTLNEDKEFIIKDVKYIKVE
jgi:hypothetical protein